MFGANFGLGEWDDDRPYQIVSVWSLLGDVTCVLAEPAPTCSCRQENM